MTLRPTSISAATAIAAWMVTACPGTAVAHHSFAMFDNTKSMTVAGTLKSVELTNPHSWFVLTTVAGDGTTQEWAVEGPSPNGLVRSGWKHTDVNAGDRVSMTIHPRKDGSLGGVLVSVRLPDGRELQSGAGPHQIRAPLPSFPPNTPVPPPAPTSPR